MGRWWWVMLCFVVSAVAGCAAPPWGWQDVRTPARTEPGFDLDECRSYAASQYVPGIPAGAAYLQDHPVPSPLDREHSGAGIWHPDREPFPYTHRYRAPIHGVVVPYTGYPGELDYNPEFLDALVEKCMADRGWVYRPIDKGTK